MSANVGTFDRLVRALAGIILIALPFTTPGLQLWSNDAALYGLPAVGAVLVLTALTRFCPLYRLIGLRTCRA
jgi:hypothetical protein